MEYIMTTPIVYLLICYANSTDWGDVQNITLGLDDNTDLENENFLEEKDASTVVAKFWGNCSKSEPNFLLYLWFYS